MQNAKASRTKCDELDRPSIAGCTAAGETDSTYQMYFHIDGQL